jgi:two-component system phosphate regulon sensor histidine kinase PhoR
MGSRSASNLKSWNPNLQRLAELIGRNRDRVLQDWRVEVRRLPAAANLDTPTLNDHIPEVLDELGAALARGRAESVLELELEESPKVHGIERLRAGFDIVEVVAEYNILRELVQALAEQSGIDISGNVNQIVNRIFDRAVAAAVDMYARQKTVELQHRREENLAFILHDLKTPLAAMHTARDILERSLPEHVNTGRVATMLALMARNSERLNALLKAVTHEQYNIALGAVEELKIERREFELWSIVEGIIREMLPLTEKSAVQIINDVPPSLVVFADALLIGQVFQNLLSNALRYTQLGEIVIGAEQTGDANTHCWVKDTGSGIAPERLPRIFEKLETDPERRGGLGLGLTIVRNIVRAHGGTVEVESALGVGSTFSFTLPNAR